METPGFPHVSIRYETSALWVLDFPDAETQRNFRYPTMKSVEKHKETSGFCKFPKDRKPVPGISLLGNSGKPHVT